MEWNIYWYDINANRIVVRNVFKLSCKFNDSLRQLKAGKYLLSRDEFDEELRHALMYSFWCKAEHEICITDIYEHTDNGVIKKVDVYNQIMINKEHFFNYVWENLEGSEI